MRAAAACATLAVLAGPAWSQVEVVSPAPDRAAVVIYRDRPVDTASLLQRSSRPWERLDLEGLALIIETRTIDLPQGDAIVRFRGVATGIAPQKAMLEGLPGPVLESNTDYDLLSPGSLVERSVGEVVRVVRTNPETGEVVEKPAVLRSGPIGVLVEIDGRLEALDCSGLTERIIFDRAPEGLGDQPVLSVRLRSHAPGPRTLTLAYLATGLQWSADYVARVSPDGRTLDLAGWITLANFGGAGFPNAPVQVVAGDLNRDPDTVPIRPAEVRTAPACWPMDTTTSAPLDPTLVTTAYRVASLAPPPPPPPPAPPPPGDEIVVTGSRVVRMAELGDYKIYTLPEPTDVSARQTKQVQFIDQRGVAFSRIYAVDVAADGPASPEPRLMLRLRNEVEGGLGLPLPGGGVSLMDQVEGRSLFAGQARFLDKGVGLPVELGFGRALGIEVTRAVLSDEAAERQGGSRRRRTTIAVEVHNAKSEPVELEISPEEWRGRGFRIETSDRPHEIAEGGYPVWAITTPAGGRSRLQYTVVYED